MPIKGTHFSEEHRRKIGEAQRGKKLSDEHKRKISDAKKGKKLSEEHRHKISESQKGRKHTEETKQKMSDAHKGERNQNYGKTGELCHNYGRKHTEETKQKMSESQKGIKHTEETKQKMSESQKGERNQNYGKTGELCHNYGRKHTEEAKRKISDAQKGRKHTEETKRKMSDVHKGKHVGDKSPTWKGGISFEPYCHKFNNAFKESIREKFGRVCFLCPTTEEENGRKLCVHHVNYDKNCLCDDVKCEFVPLCNTCHSKTNNKREYWENLITEKLKNKQHFHVASSPDAIYNRANAPPLPP